MPLFFGDAVHLLVHQLDQFPDVALGEDVGTNLPDHHLLEAPCVEPGAVAGPAAPFHQGLADVVGELPALGVLSGHGPAATAALDQAAEQVGASHAAGMGLPGSARAHLPVDLAELGLGDDGGERLLHPNRLSLVLGTFAPYQGAGVSLVTEDDVDAVLGPEPAGGVGDALAVQGAGDVQDALARLGQVEDAFHHRESCRIGFQGRTLLRPVLDVDLPVAVGNAAGDPETPGGGFPHPPQDLLGKIFRVKFVHGLNDGLHQLAGGGVVGVLGDGDDADALAPEHGLEGYGVFPLAGESRKLPDENLPEGRLRLGSLVQHPAKLGPVGDAPTLGLVDVLAGYGVAVAFGVVAEGAKLGGNGEVHVLAVAGDPGIEGRRGQGLELLVFHLASLAALAHVLPASVSSVFAWRERRCIRSLARHSRSSM